MTVFYSVKLRLSVLTPNDSAFPSLYSKFPLLRHYLIPELLMFYLHLAFNSGTFHRFHWEYININIRISKRWSFRLCSCIKGIQQWTQFPNVLDPRCISIFVIFFCNILWLLSPWIYLNLCWNYEFVKLHNFLQLINCTKWAFLVFLKLHLLISKRSFLNFIIPEFGKHIYI